MLRTGVIQDAALADHPMLFGGDTDGRFKWQGKSSDNKVSIAHRNVSPEFIATSGMKIIEGRDFSENASSENSNVIINESMEKMMGKESAVGKIIQSPRGNPDGVFTNMTVIGVVSDYVYGNIYGKAAPVIIFCKPPEYQNFIYVRTKAQSNVEQALAKIGAVMKKDNAAYPLEYKFVDDQFNQMFQNETLISKVSGIFAALAIIISCLGLFGLAAYTAEQRTKEIGIRKVLGASVTGITTLLSKDFLQLVIISCLVAFPVAWWIMHDWLQNYEYRITNKLVDIFSSRYCSCADCFNNHKLSIYKSSDCKPRKKLADRVILFQPCKFKWLLLFNIWRSTISSRPLNFYIN